jgi:hypothetical protein
MGATPGRIFDILLKPAPNTGATFHPRLFPNSLGNSELEAAGILEIAYP